MSSFMAEKTQAEETYTRSSSNREAFIVWREGRQQCRPFRSAVSAAEEAALEAVTSFGFGYGS